MTDITSKDLESLRSETVVDETNSTTEKKDSQQTSENADESDGLKDLSLIFKDWGSNVDKLFQIAYKFYKRNESKAFHPTFDDRNKMNALILQARYGNLDTSKFPDVGALDLVGRSRRYEWSLLNGMSKKEAMTKFISTLDEICPIFKAHAKAVKIYSENQKPTNNYLSTISSNGDSDNLVNVSTSSNENSEDDQLKAIHTSLCRQTYDQFKSYAVKQHPNDSIRQREMITCLQEQYYQQYVSQMHSGLSKPATRGEDTELNSNSKESNQEEKDIKNHDSANLKDTCNENNLEEIDLEPLNSEIPDTSINSNLYHTSQNEFPVEKPPNLDKDQEPLDIPTLRSGNHNSREQNYNLTQECPNNLIPPISCHSSNNFPLQASDTLIEPPKTSNGQVSSIQETPRTVEAWDYSEDDDDDLESGENVSPLRRGSVTYEPLEPATLWTKKGVNEFKASLINDEQAGTYVVNQGILATIQVPTYPDGKYIYWEFVTDDYDIAFGVDFIYDFNMIEPHKISIFERTDEDDDSEDENFVDGVGLNSSTKDVEAAMDGVCNNASSSNTSQDNTGKMARSKNTLVILPTYRRDSHEEVFVGRHKYPGPGYYHLKFDNTYSVLRQKSLYFRICYFI